MFGIYLASATHRPVASSGGQAQQHAAFGGWANPRPDESAPAAPDRGPDPEVLARVRDIIEQNLSFDAELGGLLGMSELFLTGGRRSGKTFLMEAILCSYAVVVPDSISRAGDLASIVRL